MNKYKETFGKIWEVIFGSLAMIVGIGFAIGIPTTFFLIGRIWAGMFIALFTLCVGGYFFHRGLGIVFFNDQLEKTDSYHTIDGGRTMSPIYRPVQTKRYLNRMSIFGFIESVLYFILCITSTVLIFTFPQDMGWFIFSAISSLIVSVIMFFFVGKGSKEDIKNKNYKADD